MGEDCLSYLCSPSCIILNVSCVACTLLPPTWRSREGYVPNRRHFPSDMRYTTLRAIVLLASLLPAVCHGIVHFAASGLDQQSLLRVKQQQSCMQGQSSCWAKLRRWLTQTAEAGRRQQDFTELCARQPIMQPPKLAANFKGKGRLSL